MGDAWLHGYELFMPNHLNNQIGSVEDSPAAAIADTYMCALEEMVRYHSRNDALLPVIDEDAAVRSSTIFENFEYLL